MKAIISVFFLLVLFVFVGCAKDSPENPDNFLLSAPSEINIITAENKAIVSGKATIGSLVTIKYSASGGQVLCTVQADTSGRFSVSIDLLADYEQELEAFATKGGEKSETVRLIKIPAKAAYAGSRDATLALLQAHRWKSDQASSRTLIKQTKETPPYEMFATVAQKFFGFHANGVFFFEVTTPLKFVHATGEWSMSEQCVIDIRTVIPLGPMRITEAKIQHLDSERMSLLAKISDGLFLLSFTK